MRKKLHLSIIFLVFLITVYLYIQIFESKVNRSFEVNFLDVGQGDSILIKTKLGQNILIDGGPDNSIISELDKHISSFNRVIDLMILTHPHDDHLRGLLDVIKRYEVKQILYTGVTHSSFGYLEWLRLIKEKDIPLIIVDGRKTISLGNHVFLEILYPDKSFLYQEVDNLNNTSIVLKLIYNDSSFLFVGDIEEEAERYLVSDNSIDLKADVLKVAHHGSSTSSSDSFLDKVSPHVCVIQVGEGNSFNHPSLRVLNRLDRKCNKVYRNDVNKGIKILVDSSPLRVFLNN